MDRILQQDIFGDSKDVTPKKKRRVNKSGVKDYKQHMGNRKHVGDFVLFGGGVQSATILYMMHAGVLPKPLAVIMADTGDEMRDTQDMIPYYRGLCREMGVPFVECGVGGISAGLRSWVNGNPYWEATAMGTMPVWVKVEGQSKPGRLRRQCSDYAKVLPSQNAMKGFMLKNRWAKRRKGESLEPIISMSGRFFSERDLYSDDDPWTHEDYYNQMPYGTPRIVVKDTYVRCAFGITTDESYRISDRGLIWQQAWYPLYEMGMTREDCERWVVDNGYRLPGKSACTMCPYRSNESWLVMHTTHQYLVGQAQRRADLERIELDPHYEFQIASDWNKACEVDEMLRNPRFLMNNPFYGRIRGVMYIHESCTPLRELGKSGQLRELVEEERRKAAEDEQKRRQMTPLERALKIEIVQKGDTCGSRGVFNCFS